MIASPLAITTLFTIGPIAITSSGCRDLGGWPDRPRESLATWFLATGCRMAGRVDPFVQRSRIRSARRSECCRTLCAFARTHRSFLSFLELVVRSFRASNRRRRISRPMRCLRSIVSSGLLFWHSGPWGHWVLKTFAEPSELMIPSISSRLLPVFFRWWCAFSVILRVAFSSSRSCLRLPVSSC